MLCALFSTAFGQINEDSPFPVDFEILAPGSITGVFDYGSMVSNADNPIWGPTLSQTVSGEIAWAFNEVDSLGCTAANGGGPVITDLTGKFALIRRGACAFSEKVRSAQEAGAIACLIVNHYDDPAQDGATIVGMLGTAPADDIVIPAAFINRNTGETILSQLDAGNTVVGSFTVKSFYDPLTSFSYHTPLSEALDFDNFQINYVNPNDTDIVDVAVSAVITSPSGAETTLTGSSTVAPLADSVVVLDGSFLPTEAGLHTVVFNNDQSDETATGSFMMTDFTYATDNGDIAGSSAGPSDADFASTFAFKYQAGSLVLVDGDGAVATHASFGISNAAAVATGDPEADQVAIILYDGDNDDDGLLDFAATGGSFDDLAAVALATYTITGNEQPDELITVALEDLFTSESFVELKPDGAYYIVIAYDGTNAGTGVAPRFVASEDIPYLNFPTTPIFLDQLYTGWSDRTVAVRLHLDGFVIGTNDLPELAADKVTIAPNPVSTRLNVKFDLEETADEVSVYLLDVNGRLLQTYQYENVLNKTAEIDVNRLPAGTYFLNIITPEGFTAEKVIKQ